jgi:hypothetical protein
MCDVWILSGDTDAGEMQIPHNFKEKQLVSETRLQ